MKKKIKDLTIGECAAICKYHRNNKDLSAPCAECALGGYNCGAIFGMRLPSYLLNKTNIDNELIMEEEIDV